MYLAILVWVGGLAFFCCGFLFGFEAGQKAGNAPEE